MLINYPTNHTSYIHKSISNHKSSFFHQSFPISGLSTRLLPFLLAPFEHFAPPSPLSTSAAARLGSPPQPLSARPNAPVAVVDDAFGDFVKRKEVGWKNTDFWSQSYRSVLLFSSTFSSCCVSTTHKNTIRWRHFKPPWPRLLLCPPLRISRSFPGTQPMFLWSLKVFRYFYLNSTLRKTQQKNNALPFCFRRNPKILDFLDNHTPAKKKQGNRLRFPRHSSARFRACSAFPGGSQDAPLGMVEILGMSGD